MNFMFPAEVSDIVSVPEQFRSLYEKPEGETAFKMVSDPRVKGAVEGLVGLGKALDKARGDADAARKSKIDLTPLKDYGEDPVSIAAAFGSKIKELQDQLAGEGKKKLDLEAIRTSMAAENEKIRKDWEEKYGKLRKEMHRVKVTDALNQELLRVSADELLAPFAEKYLRSVDSEDGGIDVQVVDEKGNVRYNGTGQYMTIAEKIAEMKGDKKWAKFFPSEAPRGGGAAPGGGSGRQKPSESDDADMTPAQKIRRGLEARMAGKK